jgi:hypothetical protein
VEGDSWDGLMVCVYGCGLAVFGPGTLVWLHGDVGNVCAAPAPSFY